MKPHGTNVALIFSDFWGYLEKTPFWQKFGYVLANFGLLFGNFSFTFWQKGILFHIFRPRVGEEKREKVFEKVFDRFTESRSLEAQNEGWMDGFQ